MSPCRGGASRRIARFALQFSERSAAASARRRTRITTHRTRKGPKASRYVATCSAGCRVPRCMGITSTILPSTTAGSPQRSTVLSGWAALRLFRLLRRKGTWLRLDTARRLDGAVRPWGCHLPSMCFCLGVAGSLHRGACSAAIGHRDHWMRWAGPSRAPQWPWRTSASDEGEPDLLCSLGDGRMRC